MEKKCKECGKEFYVKPSWFLKAKFCSKICFYKSLIGKKATIATRLKMSISGKGKKRSKELKENLRIKRLGILNPFYGKKHSKISRNKISIGITGKRNPNFKGQCIDRGYIALYKPDHKNCSVRHYIFEHRLVIEKIIGRYIGQEERVHHINKIKHDNRIENLMLFATNSAHTRWHKNPNTVKPEEIIFDGRRKNESS